MAAGPPEWGLVSSSALGEVSILLNHAVIFCRSESLLLLNYFFVQCKLIYHFREKSAIKTYLAKTLFDLYTDGVK